ncbi:MAG: hypothetical protein LBP59_01480 [Planctomycetaceae bacterium]|nr:hypothetical protein [Planctomycetaceae bacterium]
MTKRFFVSVSALAVFLTVNFALNFIVVAKSPTIISYRDNFKAFASSDFVQRLFNLPEWEPFAEAYTDACDNAIERELSQDKLNQMLPAEVAQDLRQFIESDITTRKGVQTVFQHLDAIIFELRADFDDDDIDENLKDITDIALGRTKDFEIDFDGVLAFIVDINPRPLISFLKYFREGTDYKFIRNEPDGDFILKFDFEYRNRDIEFCCAGVKLGVGRYAVIFADDDQISRYCQAFKTGRYSKLDTTQKKKELVVDETCFLFIDRQLKLAKINSNGIEFFSKIKGVKSTLYEEKNKLQFEIDVKMRTVEDSAAFRDLLTGLTALVQLNTAEKSPEREFLQTVKINAGGTNVSVKINLDNPEVWKLIAKRLKEVTDKIQNRQ